MAHALAIPEAISEVVAILATGRLAFSCFFAEVVVAGGAAFVVNICRALVAIRRRRDVARNAVGPKWVTSERQTGFDRKQLFAFC